MAGLGRHRATSSAQSEPQRGQLVLAVQNRGAAECWRLWRLAFKADTAAPVGPFLVTVLNDKQVSRESSFP